MKRVRYMTYPWAIIFRVKSARRVAAGLNQPTLADERRERCGVGLATSLSSNLWIFIDIGRDANATLAVLQEQVPLLTGIAEWVDAGLPEKVTA